MKSAESALAEIKALAAAGKIEFGERILTTAYDTEIQEIYRMLILSFKKFAPKRSLWVADGVHIGVALDWTTEGYTQDSLLALSEVNRVLGLELGAHTLWEDAGAQLRSKRAAVKE